ncbi:MAG: hypothetical protein ACI4AK_08120 [Lepagella sp.]
MKSLKNLIASMTIVLIMGLSLTACEDKSQAQTNDIPEEPEQEQTNVTVPEINKEVKDSLYKYTARIDTIFQIATKAREEVTSMKETVDSTKEDVSNLQGNELWMWIALGIAVFALLIAIYAVKLNYGLQNRADRQRQAIDKLKSIVHELKPTSGIYSGTVSRTTVPSDYEGLKKRVLELEYQLKQLGTYVQSIKTTAQKVDNPVITGPVKTGYFGTPINSSEPYFKKLLVSCDSEARFKVDIKGDRATFKPLESTRYLGTFVSNDAMRAAVDFTGCTPSQASSMYVRELGEAVQRDSKWIITKKATVTLS